MLETAANKNTYDEVKVTKATFAELISMARCALDAKERLEKIHKSVCEDMCDEVYHKSYGNGFFASQDVIDNLLELSLVSPKDLLPPAQCAPPAVTDVPPVCAVCHGRGGWECGLRGKEWQACPTCS